MKNSTATKTKSADSMEEGMEEDPFVRLAARETRAREELEKKEQRAEDRTPTQQTQGFRLTLTQHAVAQLHALRKQESDDTLTLRVRIHAGGCSGYRTEFSLDKKKTPRDLDITQDGVRILIDRISAQTIGASQLDYERSLTSEQFRLLADKAHNACGCGVSFAL